ncbi:16S rRNA (uracil(1498)-N(3))-methyltransferase [Odoribacter laneus]|jgi:RNA methyltransferase, rsmE family|uniref:Ribosomal RNA small subunit methyltransferase E n=1 Tax=Odoribacter laneus YIT 12061 TaxID=742817 RepID=H1DJS4_9BACT|nr:16S rRNA (uracil(1498)-N(3))-methyltransferase [Odoribacter laneus]EHP45924.1 RsmE family RNA methyltransferase [Odoribacter laneus YIT 12061]MBS1445763.1 16S rRNA (uracil(1498)-N(3))-methyltransferase [Odoribacter sp.]
MHLFYTPDIEGEIYRLNPEESKHCIKVLRLEEGDTVALVDGRGGFYSGIITVANVKGCQVKVTACTRQYEKRPFCLHIAIAPTKNIERTEWFLEKCTEIGIDEFTPIAAAHSERRVVKEERLEKVIVAAMKQSLKAYLPVLHPMMRFQEFLVNCQYKHKFIAHCQPGTKKRLDEVYTAGEDAVILIGPEGDFSEEEVAEAAKYGFVSITLGPSRLRTETAGVVACHSINFLNEQQGRFVEL